jgi:pimeloyl-ACP methyl ester carboxylesterase
MVIQSTYINAERKRVALGAGQSTPYLDLIKDKVAHARLQVLPGVGHFAQIEAAGEVNRLVSDFIVQYAMARPKARR